MALTLAEDLGTAAAIAPLASPLGVLPFSSGFLDPGRGIVTLDWIIFPVLTSYLFMRLAVVPTLLATRRNMPWTPARLLLLGSILAASPFLMSFLWVLAVSTVNGSVMRTLATVADRDPTPLAMFVCCGLITAAAFVVIQLARHRNAN